jgi:ribosomal-protein-alanine N-acetyltransferase
MESYLQPHETERLQMRALTLADIPGWFEFLSDEKCTELFPADLKGDRAAAEKWIEYQLERYETKRWGFHALVVEKTGDFIGMCGLLAQEVDEVAELEIGFHLKSQYWGNGYATEAANYWKNYAFDRGLADSIISMIDVRNTPSQRVADRNGMSREKRTIWRELDMYVYRIHKADWLAASSPGQTHF